jgi:hypothetical protein
MREVHPYNLDLEEVLRLEPKIRAMTLEIRRQKAAGERPKPSSSFVDKSKILTNSERQKLIDKIADLVDENHTGRSDMCQQFADLLCRALNKLGFSARVATGTVSYYDNKGNTIFRWPPDGHDWVLVGDELIDGNVDCLSENPFLPKTIQLQAYWGPRTSVPSDRKFMENRGARTRESDSDVEKIWWPDLEEWIGKNLYA